MNYVSYISRTGDEATAITIWNDPNVNAALQPPYHRGIVL